MRQKHLRVVAAATDGACSGNPGPGGWAALMRFEDGSVEEFGGFDKATTNNRMELQAAIFLLETLQEFPRKPGLQIRTDSKYVINGFSQWIVNWKLKGWRTASGKPVQNKDLWEALDSARLLDVTFSYVKGHSGDPDNERVDQIAVCFSKGELPTLESSRGKSFEACELVEPLDQIKDEVDKAPVALEKLLTRLELADRFAKNGYSLNTFELAELIEQPVAELEKRTTSWLWRDWLVEPIDDHHWRLGRLKNEYCKSERVSGE